MEVAKLAIAALKRTGFYDGYWAHWRGRLFDHAQRKGLHVLPVHYYSPVPNTEVLDTSSPPSKSFAFDVAASVQKISRLVELYAAELIEIFEKPVKGLHDYDPDNSAYAPLDAAVLFGMVRERKPSRIIEIGSGNSTLIISAAIRAIRVEDPTYAPQFVCIEPYVPHYLQPPPVEVSEVVPRELQTVPISFFQQLSPGDFLFIDSTHVVNYGSDVVYEILEILPALPVGVIVHIHDIFLPFNYPASWLTEYRFFWNEQYLLQAFMAMNPHYIVEIGVHAAAREMDIGEIPALTSNASSVFPASFWISRIS